MAVKVPEAPRPTLIHYNKEISKCSKCKGEQWQRAIMLLRKVQRNDLEANVISYNSTISAIGQWNRAIHLLKEVQMKDLEADVISFSTTTSASQKATEWTWAVLGLEMMRTSGMKPNEINYGTALGENWQQALEMFSEMTMSRLRKNVISYGSLMCICEAAGKWQEAVLLLKALEDAALSPNALIFRAAIGACGAQWQHALKLLSQAIELKQRNLMTCNEAISACGKAGEWQQSLKILIELIEHGHLSPDAISFGAAMSSCEKFSEWQQVLELLQLAEGLGTTDAVLYKLGISGCGAAAAWQAALELYHEAGFQHGERLSWPNI